MPDTVVSVVKKGLCAGCGTCAGVCPENAIEMEIDSHKGVYFPRVNDDKCTRCGVCYRSCPGYEVDFHELLKTAAPQIKHDILIGNYLDCFTGYSTDEAIRYNATSGGLVTQFLITALETGQIDGALVTDMHRDNPLETVPFVARTREEIIKASQSKYCPVSANTALKTILQSEGRYAVIGLPCHLHGVRKAEQANRELKEKIVLHLGLICGHMPSYWAMRTFLYRLRINPAEVSRVSYRGEGWPGKVVILKKDGSRHVEPIASYYSTFGSAFFIPSRCLKCCDMTAELSDLSFGDAWVPEFKDDKTGRSIVIVRSEAGLQLLKQAEDSKAVELAPADSDLIKRSQTEALYYKKQVAEAHLALAAYKPVYNTELLKPKISEYILAVFSNIDHCYSTNRLLRLLLQGLPLKLLAYLRLPYGLIIPRSLKKFRTTMRIGGG